MESTVPLAVIVAVLGVVIARAGPPTGGAWWPLLSLPLPALTVGVMSTILATATYGGTPPIDADLWWTTEHLAWYGLGWAVALLLVADRWRRVLLGSILSAAATYAIDVNTIDAIESCLIAAIIIWSAARLRAAVRPGVDGRLEQLTTTALTPPTA